MPKKGRGKRKKQTPPGLDFAFKRHLIPEDDYKNFWPRYWDATKKQKEEIIEELLGAATELRDEDTLPPRGPVVLSFNDAQKQARAMGGIVVRRNAKGRFSRTGKRYQAIRRKTRK